MKNLFFSIATLFVVGFAASCQKENINEQTSAPVANYSTDRGDGTVTGPYNTKPGTSSTDNGSVTGGSNGGSVTGGNTGGSNNGGTVTGGSGGSTDNGGSVTGSGGSVTETWTFCGTTMLVMRQKDANGQLYLTLADAAGNPKIQFQATDGFGMPDNVVDAADAQMNGYTKGQVWISYKPDASYYLVESAETPGVAALINKGGTVICQGSK